MAGAAFSGSVEIGAPGFCISRDDIQRSARISIAGNGFHALVKKVREIHDLSVGQCGLMCRSFLSGRTDAVAQPIPQNDRRADEIRAAIGSLRGASVAVDAVLGVDEAATIGGSIIDALPLGGAGLRE